MGTLASSTTQEYPGQPRVGEGGRNGRGGEVLGLVRGKDLGICLINQLRARCLDCCCFLSDENSISDLWIRLTVNFELAIQISLALLVMRLQYMAPMRIITPGEWCA